MQATEVPAEVHDPRPPLVLLHGWGMHGGVWACVADALARHDQPHLVDLPGYGNGATVTPYTLEALATHLAGVLPPHFNLCGWSLGGQVALALAHFYPARVGRLVTVSTNPCFVTRADWAHGINRELLRTFGENLANDYAGTLKRFLALQAHGGKAARAVLAHLDGMLFERGRPDPAVLGASLAILLNTDLRPRVAGIFQPTLVIQGNHDSLTPMAAGEWLARHLPNGHFCPIAGASHAPFLSHGIEFVSAVTDFLHDRHPA